ncbi:hypothetical protein EC991_001016 [Linnemannia zychae]|nr:hypothetical protein EC991_001016 [Linnemannia zychae]
MTELHYTYALDINTLVISLDRYRQALIYDTVRTLTRASSETEEEEVKEEKIEEKRVAGEKSDEDHEDEDEDDSEESILPWVICKTLRSDFNILSFAADYKNAARARAASRVAAKAAVIAQAELGLLRTNNLRRRYGGSLVEVCSHAVKGSSTSCAILDEGSTNDCYMSYIDYPDNLGEDEDGHECGLHVNIDAAANVDVGYTGVLGEIVTKDNSKEDSTERAVQAVESWQSQTRTLPLLGLLAAAIPDDQDLVTAVQAITKTHPDTTPTITRLLTYMQAKHASKDSTMKQPQGIAQFFKPVSFNNTASATAKTLGAGASAVDAPIGPAIYSTNPISFLHPARKKLALSLHKSHITLVTTPSSNPASTEVVFKAPYEALYRIVAVPFLERATKNTALILFFRHSAFAAGGGSGAKDAIWAVPLPDDGKDFSLQAYAPNLGLVGLSQDLRITTSKQHQPPLAFVNPPTVTGPTKRPDHTLLSILSYFLQYNDTNKTNSSTNIMDRIIPNPTPAYPNFSAHLKSNQGTIYLLPTGILFAFRKPVLFLRSAVIEAVGIHSVLSRTFDFEIVMDTTSPSDATSSGNSNGKDESRRGATVEDLEGVPESKDGRRAIGFGMVDTKEFGRMEEWIKKAGIRDRSMSEDLKAKDKAPTSGAGAGGAGKKRERAADGEEEEGAEGVVQKAAKGNNDGADEDDDDDDEDDDDFAPESEDELMEEYDSNAEGSDSDGGEDVGEEEGSSKKGKASGEVRKAGVEKKKFQKQEDVDLDEESLGEDSEDDEDEDEED